MEIISFAAINNGLYRWLAEYIVCILLGDHAVSIAQGHDRAETIEVIIVWLITIDYINHADRLIHARAIDEFSPDDMER